MPHILGKLNAVFCPVAASSVFCMVIGRWYNPATDYSSAFSTKRGGFCGFKTVRDSCYRNRALLCSWLYLRAVAACFKDWKLRTARTALFDSTRQHCCIAVLGVLGMAD